MWMFWGFTASSLIQNDSVLGYIWIVVTELNKWYSYSPDIFKPNIIHISIWMNFQTIIYSFLYLHNLSNQNIIHIRLKFENWIAQISPRIKFCFVIKFHCIWNLDPMTTVDALKFLNSSPKSRIRDLHSLLLVFALLCYLYPFRYYSYLYSVFIQII